MLSPQIPQLTAIVVVGRIRDRAGRLLESLLHQEGREGLEVLLVDLAAEAGAVALADDPRVSVLPMPPDSLLGAARAAAVRRARAPLILFLEEHTACDAGFLTAVLAAASDDWVAAGPLVRNGNPGTLAADAAYQAGYALFAPPWDERSARAVSALPGFNTIVRRDALLARGADLELLLCADNVLHSCLEVEGGRLTLIPAAVIRHWNEATVRGICAGYWWFHRNYGALRAQCLNWPRRRRWLYVVATPAIPLYALALWLTRQRARRLPLLPVVRLMPVGLLATLVGAVSQAVGLVFGPSHKAHLRFTRLELDNAGRGPLVQS